MCVDLPTPSVPSMTMSFPLISLTSRYGSPAPKNVFFLFDIDILLPTRPGKRPVILEAFLDNLAHNGLLLLNRQRSIEHGKVAFDRDAVVLLDDLGLEELETFTRIIAQAEVHTRLMEFQVDAA